jgi:hypothetical protein
MNRPRILLAAILLLYAVMAMVAIDWGLPSRAADPYLFGGGPVWSGETIHRLAGGDAWGSPERGADVDANPLDKTSGPVNLTASESDVAAIYLRYRLYTHQPDEMITLRALAGMRPSQLQLDPRLYQYGGLFIYPVGALLRVAGAVGMIDVRSDVPYYLDHPDEFAKFYIVARVYVAAWGAVGLFVISAIATRLQNAWAGVLAALLYAILPVVVCMAHEGKPHLPAAVLMLLAVLLALGYVDTGRRRDWIGMCAACGAAFGTVLSAFPIFILIPVAEFLRLHREVRTGAAGRGGLGPAMMRIVLGGLIGIGVYLVANPYVFINLFVNRAVLKSNFGNSLAMYEISRIAEGVLRVVELTGEGASAPVMIFGVIVLAVAIRRKQKNILPLAAPAALVLVQFALLGAGKPAEYGRFGVFPSIALAVATACGLTSLAGTKRRVGRWIAAALVVAWTGISGAAYLVNLHADNTPDNTRTAAAAFLAPRIVDGRVPQLWLQAEPAPYSCPPINFAAIPVWLCPDADNNRLCPGRPLLAAYDGNSLLTRDRSGPLDDGAVTFEPWFCSPISWANKPIRIYPAPNGDHGQPPEALE